jgi:hypothetical protein
VREPADASKLNDYLDDLHGIVGRLFLLGKIHRHCDRNEAVSEACLIALRALETYDESRGELLAWVRRCVYLDLPRSMMRVEGYRRSRHEDQSRAYAHWTEFAHLARPLPQAPDYYDSGTDEIDQRIDEEESGVWPFLRSHPLVSDEDLELLALLAGGMSRVDAASEVGRSARWAYDRLDVIRPLIADFLACRSDNDGR